MNRRVLHLCRLGRGTKPNVIGTQNPHQIWLAIDRAMRKPKVDYPPIRIFRFSGPSLKEGVEEKKIEGVSVRFYFCSENVCYGPEISIARLVTLICLHLSRKLRILERLLILRDHFFGRRSTLS
jgi:hypothetical protein